MPHRLSLTLLLLALPLASQPLHAQGEPTVIQELVAEGTERSQVWSTLEFLSHDIGPRLTGSTNLALANAWTRDEFHRMGLSNVHLDHWGEIPVRFDRGPCRARMVAPTERELQFTARAWSRGTEGPLRARVVERPETLQELAACRAELDGAWVLTKARERGRRGRRPNDETEEQRLERERAAEIASTIEEALRTIPVAGRLTSSRNDLCITGGVRGWRELTMETLPEGVEVTIRRSDYEALAGALETGAEVLVEVDLAHHFVEGPFPLHNTVAEIPGTDLAHEIVLMSGHLDTWDGPGTQGAQDNGTGCAVMLEAARILSTVGVRPRRTIRFCLWTGEEQGLLGSRAYVASLSEEERGHISAALVEDGGTNYQGGLVCIESMREMLDRAIAPVVTAFPDFEIANVVRDRMPRGGGSDHAAFNRVGIPGFFWIEKGIGGREQKNYSFIHHTQHDTTRYAIEEYLVQSATCSAVVAYQLAMADGLLPREVPGDDASGPPPDQSFRSIDGPLTGAWLGTLTGEEVMGVPFTITLDMAEDGRVRGEITSSMGKGHLREGSWDADELQTRLSGESDLGPFTLEAKLTNGHLVGTLILGQELPFEARRPPTVPTPISGVWTAHIPERDATLRLRFEVGEGGELYGWFSSSLSSSPLHGGRWNAEEATLRFEYDNPFAGRLEVKGRLEGDAITGTIGGRMDFHATREKGSEDG